MELKPCPICNSAAEIFSNYFDSNEIFGVTCTIDDPCLTLDDVFKSEAEAIAAWNQLPIEDELRARVKELESRLDAYAESNAKLMEEKLRDAQLIKQLEAWQKEAVPFIRLAKEALKHSYDICIPEELYRKTDTLKFLIKQAEEHGK